jgi:Bacterial PH domain
VSSAEQEPTPAAPAGQPGASPAPAGSQAKPAKAQSKPATAQGMPAGAQPAGAQPAAAGSQPDRFRSPVAVIFFCIWTAFAVANLVDLAVQGHNHFGATIAAVLLLVTGVVYTTSLRPQVVADDHGVKITNPVRGHYVPWGAVDQVDLGDSLQLKISWNDGITEHRKSLYAWAVHSPRRGRLKADMRAKRLGRPPERPSTIYGRLPPEMEKAQRRNDAEHMTRAVEERAALAHAQGMIGGAPESKWHWPSIAAVVLPAILLLIVILV